MLKVLIICGNNPNQDPRPNRTISWLKDKHEVCVLANEKFESDMVTSFLFQRKPYGKYLTKIHRIIKNKNIDFLFFPSFICDQNLLKKLASKKFDVIISHGIIFLPLIFFMKDNKTRVILDAEEYYPQNFSDQFLWKLLERPKNVYLCMKYLKRCDKVFTVSKSFSEKYYENYKINSEVLLSLPQYCSLEPLKPDPNHIKIVHHGIPSKSRKIELMIKMMDYLDSKYHLYLYLIPENSKYWDFLKDLTLNRKNIHIMEPVPLSDLVKTLSKYDIGLFLVPPSNYNLLHTLPNKLFEFIQARLCLVFTPSYEMKKIIEDNNCGVISPDFSPVTMANIIKGLSDESIAIYKSNSNNAAKKYNSEKSREIFEKTLISLFN